jgi:nucleotide-binding universal stress UspA family protein
LKIVIALDRTEKDDPLIQHVSAIAKDARAEVVLLHVINPFVDASDIEAATRTEAVAQLVARTKSYLEDRSTAFDGLKVEILVTEVQRGGDDVETCIARTAKEVGGDIVAVASKRVGGLTGALLGSVTQSLLGNSPCPVLIVRPD